jgi:transposase InsO family protein
VVSTAFFKLLYGLVILGHKRRQVIGFGVTHPTAEWIARQVREAFPWDDAPRYLIRDRDGAFAPAYMRRIRARRVCDHQIVARSPWQNGNAERLISTDFQTFIYVILSLFYLSFDLSKRVQNFLLHFISILATVASLLR